MSKSVTIPSLIRMKQEGKKIAVLTAYDYSTARLMDESGIDIILVGDSLGNVILGYQNTLPVTMEDMLHHTSAVARGVENALIVADMPYMSYQLNSEQARSNAGRFLKEAGAHAVKLEGGASVTTTVHSLVEIGIPVMGHLGLTPQSLHMLGGYSKQAKTEESRKQLIEDAISLQDAGAFAIVLELVDEDAAEEITNQLSIPTIGIGSGSRCDGQVLVVNDMLGMDERFQPKHVKRYLQLHSLMKDAFVQYRDDVKSGTFQAG